MWVEPKGRRLLSRPPNMTILSPRQRSAEWECRGKGFPTASLKTWQIFVGSTAEGKILKLYNAHHFKILFMDNTVIYAREEEVYKYYHRNCGKLNLMANEAQNSTFFLSPNFISQPPSRLRDQYIRSDLHLIKFNITRTSLKILALSKHFHTKHTAISLTHNYI